MAKSDTQNQSTQSQSSSRAGQSSSQGSQGGKIDNVLYDVVTVLHEKSKGLEAYDKYDRDLQGRNEIKQIFDEIRRNDEQAVQRLQDCLRELVGESSPSGKKGSKSEEAA
jgi:hypothetical protein